MTPQSPGSECRHPCPGDHMSRVSRPLLLSPTAHSTHGARGMRTSSHCSANTFQQCPSLSNPCPAKPAAATLPSLTHTPLYADVSSCVTNTIHSCLCHTSPLHPEQASRPVLSHQPSSRCSGVPSTSKGRSVTLEGKSGPSNKEVLGRAASVGRSFLTLSHWLFGSARDLVLPTAQAFGSNFPQPNNPRPIFPSQASGANRMRWTAAHPDGCSLTTAGAAPKDVHGSFVYPVKKKNVTVFTLRGWVRNFSNPFHHVPFDQQPSSGFPQLPGC